MIRTFINYCNQIFPSIDTNVVNEIKDIIGQFDLTKPNWFSNKLEELSQGDIIERIPFTYFDDKGEEVTFLTKAIVLSNTCDLTRDEYIMVAPLIPIGKEFKKNTRENLKNNIVSGKMCFTNSDLDDYYVDFSRSASFSRKIILDLLKKGKTNVIHSLSQFGFYFLCIKITIYYLRVENYGVFDSRTEKAFL